MQAENVLLPMLEPGLAEAVNRELERDREYFRLHPQRDFRVRRVGIAEAKTVPDLEPRDGFALMCIVWATDWGRLRIHFTAPAKRPGHSYTRDEAADITEASFGVVKGQIVNFWEAPSGNPA